MELQVLDQDIYDCEQNLAIENNLGKILPANKWIIRFWQNLPCVIMGRFQREEYEVVKPYLEQHNIKLLKRETGGGTVFHDLGTLNVSLVKPIHPPLRAKTKDATVCTEIIGQALSKLNFNVNVTERNAIFIGEQKILGSAAALTNGVSHYHCSILFDTNLEQLNNSINWQPIYNESDKTFVKSHRSPVVNLKSLQPTLTLTELKNTIFSEFKIKLGTL